MSKAGSATGSRVSTTRRKFLGYGAAGAGGLFLGGMPWNVYGQDAKHEGEVVFGCNGGLTQQMFEQKLIPPFTAATGIKVTYVTGQPADNVAKVRAQGARPAIDVLWLAGGITYQAIDAKIVAPVDWNRIPASKDVAGLLDAAAPIGVAVDGILTHTEVYAKKGWAAPTSWWDFWDDKVSGHVGLYSIAVSSAPALLVKVAEMLTGDYKNLQPSFAKHKELRSRAVGFYTSAGAWETALQQGDLWIGLNTGSRAMQLKQAGQPVDFHKPKEGYVSFGTSAGIVTNAPHPNAAHAWLNYLLSVDFQSIMPETLGYGPTNGKAKVKSDMVKYFPDLSEVLMPDWRWISAQMPKIVDQWNREVEG